MRVEMYQETTEQIRCGCIACIKYKVIQFEQEYVLFILYSTVDPSLTRQSHLFKWLRLRHLQFRTYQNSDQFINNHINRDSSSGLTT